MPPSNPAAGDGAFPSNGSVRKRTAAQPPPEPRKFRSMEEIMRASNPSPSVTGDYYSDLRCEECRSGDGDHEMLLCDNCDRGYHLFCLRPIVVRVPAGSWICPSCVEGFRWRRRRSEISSGFGNVQIQIWRINAGPRKVNRGYIVCHVGLYSFVKELSIWTF